MSLSNATLSTKLRLTSITILTIFSLTLTFPIASVYADELAATPSTNQDQTVSSTEIASALRADDGLLASSDQTKTTSDSDSAIKAATAGASVDVPKDASDGVTLDPAGSNTPAIDISLPNADQAKDAKTVAPGTVAYAGNNGSANAVQATEDGGVRMLTIIDNPSAPTEYDYKVTVPGGGRIEITADGGAVVYNSNGELISSVGKPWAKDANNTPINTYFTTDGQTLTQYVEHGAPGVTYPITADPTISYSWGVMKIKFNSWETGTIARAGAAYIGARWGGAAAAFFSSLGGDWLARKAETSHQCLVYRLIPWYIPASGLWIERC